MGALPQRGSVVLRVGNESTDIPGATERQAGVMTAQHVADLEQLLRWQGSVTSGGTSTITIARQVGSAPGAGDQTVTRAVDAVVSQIVQPAIQAASEDIAALLKRVEALERAPALVIPAEPSVAMVDSPATVREQLEALEAAFGEMRRPPPLPDMAASAAPDQRTARLAELGALLAVAQIAIANNAGGYRWLHKDRDFVIDGIRMDADEYREHATAEIAKLMEGGQ
jgi:hypothetical protein